MEFATSASRDVPPFSAFSEDNLEAPRTNGLMLDGASFGLENLYAYEPGGFHPVHLGDSIGGSQRYRIIHKLGSGGFGTVWLCRDLSIEYPTYVAVKILMAESSNDNCRELRVTRFGMLDLEKDPGGQYICLPLDSFKIDGANGTHVCLVYPVLGPEACLLLQPHDDSGKHLRNLAFQAVQAMSALHSHGICHGDFTPRNVLLQTAGLVGNREEDVVNLLGDPQTVEVKTVAGEPPTSPSAPSYLVLPGDFNWSEGLRFVEDDISVIDFGESFDVDQPPDDLGTPIPYCSPELILDKKCGYGSDLWALACTLFEIRTGDVLFNMFDDDPDELLVAMVLRLGKFPESWWDSWEPRKTFFEDRVDEEGNVILVPGGLDSSIVHQPRSIREILTKQSNSSEETQNSDYRRPMSDDEIALFTDLLIKMMNYDPEERLTASEALKHDWFKL